MRTIAIALLLLCTTTGYAAQFIEGWPNLYMVGDIESGDEKKLKRILDGAKPPVMLFLASPGGDVTSAMAMGRLIRKKQLAVAVDDEYLCASSCVFVLAAGVEKIIYENARVVIHRPFLNGSLPDAASYDKNYKSMRDALEKYLREMNIPSEFLNRVVAIPPHQEEELTRDELKKYMLDGKDPAYEQAETSKQAKKLKISVIELNRRKAIADSLCSWPYPDGEIPAFDLTAHHFCEEEVKKGVAPELVDKRLHVAYRKREIIETLTDEAQVYCLVAIITANGGAKCPLRLE